MPLKENPHYFQYKGKPLYLIGYGSISSITDKNYIKEIKELYRNKGNLKPVILFNVYHNLLPWKKIKGKYNLGTFNKKYWRRLRNYIKLCERKGIIVDIYIWDDNSIENDWYYHPYNPDNNVNFGPNEISEKDEFYKTIPERNNRGLALRYQRMFVKKLLKETFMFPNVIYSLNSKDYIWNMYWESFIKNFSKDLITASPVNQSKAYSIPWINRILTLDYDIDDDSDIIKFNIRDYFKKKYEMLYDTMNENNNIKPIYNPDVKNNEDLWINFINGSAAIFIRGNKGDIIKNFRDFIKNTNFFKMSPHNELVEGNAYLLANPKKEYIIYVKGEEIKVDLEDLKGEELITKWYDPIKGRYIKSERIKGSKRRFISPVDNFPILYIRRD